MERAKLIIDEVDAEGVLGRLGYKIVTDYTWLFKIILNQIENSIP